LSGYLHDSTPAALATAPGLGGRGCLGAFLLRRVLEPNLLLRRLRGVIAFFFLGATLSTLVAGTVSEVIHILLGLHHWSELPTRIYQWGRADFLGILIVTPLILAWFQKIEWKLSWSRVAEAVLLFTGLAIVCFSGFMGWAGLVNWPTIYVYAWCHSCCGRLFVWASGRHLPQPQWCRFLRCGAYTCPARG
jgi:integral membrane sensor domain MASE1